MLKKKRRYKRSIDTPVVIAFFLVLVTILFFAAWKLLFDSDIKGSWKLDFEDEGKTYSYGFTFSDGQKAEYSYGGITYLGSYALDTEQNTVRITASGSGRDLDMHFGYAFAGNAFEGRHLILTNQSDVQLPFHSGSRYEPLVQPYEDFKPDEKLLGSWLYKGEDQTYTFTFDENGRYAYVCDGLTHTGAYKVQDGIFTYNLIVDGGEVNENSCSYTIDGDKLTLSTETFSDSLTKQ